MRLLVRGPHELQPDGPAGDVLRLKRLLGDDPHVAGAGHVQTGCVPEDLVGIGSAEAKSKKNNAHAVKGQREKCSKRRFQCQNWPLPGLFGQAKTNAECDSILVKCLISEEHHHHHQRVIFYC